MKCKILNFLKPVLEVENSYTVSLKWDKQLTSIFYYLSLYKFSYNDIIILVFIYEKEKNQGHSQPFLF